MSPPGRRRGVDVNPERVRQARMEEGLSLGQVAGTEVSRAFIHQVETGRARPSRKVLALIAERTHRPIEFFTADTAELDDEVDLQRRLAFIRHRLQRFAASADLSPTEAQAVKVVASSVAQSSVVLRAIMKRLERAGINPPSLGISWATLHLGWWLADNGRLSDASPLSWSTFALGLFTS